jgi:hypothetical protein
MECESADGSVSLYWLPSRFSKVVWAQRGDFLIVGMSSVVSRGLPRVCEVRAGWTCMGGWPGPTTLARFSH